MKKTALKTLQLKKALFKNDAEAFLKTQGYTPVGEPKPGDLIIYYVSRVEKEGVVTEKTQAAHFGRIVEVADGGDVIVESKFCTFFTYRHRQDLIPCFLGNDYSYMRRG
jgi:hypothetical protein